MPYFYMDTDGGSDANDGTTWALAKLTMEGLLAAMSAGDIGVIQGLLSDSVAAARTFTSPGLVNNPIKIIGVKDGTINTGSNITVSDLPVRGVDTLTEIASLNFPNDIAFAGPFTFYGLRFTCADRLTINNEDTDNAKFIGCEVLVDRVIQTNGGIFIFTDCEVRITDNLFGWWTRKNYLKQPARMYGGTLNFQFNPSPELFTSALSSSGALFVGVDLSSMGDIPLLGPANEGDYEFINCKVPTLFSLTRGDLLFDNCSITMIGCTDDTAIPDANSIQDYKYRDTFGDIVNENIIVRTGGADDLASGLFSYAMTPRANAVLEGSRAVLKSPKLSVWVNAGSKTLTVFIANSAIAATTDYFEDEVWCEFFTPNSNDTAQHEHTFDPGISRLLESTTPITDDTGSTWGPGGNNHQKFTITVNPGFEGVAYARLYLAKRQATPDTLYLDPKIVVT